MVTTTVERIRAFYEDDVATRVPFQTHPLKESDEYTKNLYCTMLTLILQYENEPMREQIVFLERIITGIELNLPVHTLIKQAKTADVEFAKEFYDQFADTTLARNFIVDALVMIYCRQKVAEKQLEFLVEVVDVLGVDEGEFEVLVQGAKVILSTPPEKAISLYNEKVVADYELLYYLPKDDSERNIIRLFNVTLESLQKVLKEQGKTNTVYVYNSKFKLEEQFYIEETHDVYFINCEFTGNYNVHIKTNFNVTFERCYFYHMHERCIRVSRIKALYIISCKFEHCGYLYNGNGSAEGGIILSDPWNIDIELYLIDNEFNECYTKTTSTSSSYFASGAIFFGRVCNFIAIDNKFIDCRCYSAHTQKQLFRFNNYSELQQNPALLERFKEQLTDKKNYRSNSLQYNTFIGNNSPFY